MAPPMRWRSVRAQRSVGVGVRAGRLLQPRNGHDWGADVLWISGRQHRWRRFSRAVIEPRGVEEPVHARDLFMLRTGRSHGHPPVVMEGRVVRGTPTAVIP